MWHENPLAVCMACSLPIALIGKHQKLYRISHLWLLCNTKPADKILKSFRETVYREHSCSVSHIKIRPKKKCDLGFLDVNLGLYNQMFFQYVHPSNIIMWTQIIVMTSLDTKLSFKKNQIRNGPTCSIV